MSSEYFQRLKNISSSDEFNSLAVNLCNQQLNCNKIYSAYARSVNKSVVTNVKDIPFLPVEFFKSHEVTGRDYEPQQIFTSSGTTGPDSSRHFVYDLSLYEEVFQEAFRIFYGNISDYTILALLPSYLERSGSSLIYMAEKLITLSGSSESGFYLHEHEKFFNVLNQLKTARKKTLLLGVTFALLDFTEHFQIDFPDLIVMETGGMKGRRKEMIREEVHEKLCYGFGVKQIHSEYGMTELLSQAYSRGNGIFSCPPWMKIIIRDPYDPFLAAPSGHSGGINIIDLANIDSCAFIATQDIGRIVGKNQFEILGRFDFAELRGCNLLVQ